MFNLDTLEVKNDRAWAARHRYHPHALQVWDKGPRTGTPYLVYVLQRGGVPCEPDNRFWKYMWDSFADNIHRGRPGWADKVAFDSRDYEETQDQKTWSTMTERLMSNEGRIMSLLGENKYWSLNRSMIPRKQAPRRRPGIVLCR